MGMKCDVCLLLEGDEEKLRKAVRILNEKYGIFDEEFTLEEYREKSKKFEIEPSYLILDYGELPYLENLSMDLSLLGIRGGIDVYCSCRIRYFIHIPGDGDYYVEDNFSSIHIPTRFNVKYARESRSFSL